MRRDAGGRRHARTGSTGPSAGAVISVVTYGAVVLLFLLEMLLKPISGEDAEQQWCMPGGWASWRECGHWVLGFIPRVGQVFHYLVIWAFGSLPQPGLETVIRVGNAVLLVSVVVAVAWLGLGRRPGLRIKDASLVALATLLLVTSPVNQVVFNGFSNVHNYVPVMAAALVMIYGLVAHDRLVARVGRAGSWLIVGAATAATTAGFDVNALVVPGVLGAAWLSWKLVGRSEGPAPVPWTSVAAGWLLGVGFFWVLGDGLGSIQARMVQSHRDAVEVAGGLRGLLGTVWSMVGNTMANLAEYAPMLAIALVALLIATRSGQFSDIQRRASVVSVAFGMLTLLGLAPLTDVMNRVSALAFVVLLVPVCMVVGWAVDHCALSRGKIVAAGAAVAVVSALLVVDNTAFLVDRLERTEGAFERISAQGCIDRATVAEAALPDESALFRLHRDEHPFSYIFSGWYPPHFRLDGVSIPIVDTCE